MQNANEHLCGPISQTQPDRDATAGTWVNWYLCDFLPAWVERARDPNELGFFDLLDQEGQPANLNRKSVLAHARLLFTFSHLALLSDNSAYLKAAQDARAALDLFLKPSGLYCRGLTRDGQISTDKADRVATSYDQSFVILALSTWGQLDETEDTNPALKALWSAIETHLIDPKTGLLLEHDDIVDPAAMDAPPRAQNPHMHSYEAALQAFEMTGDPIWMARAQTMRAKALEYFFDRHSGTIMEFIAPDLKPLPGRDGQWREVGHQCEWAWLLLREVELGGDHAVSKIAARLLAFADQHGFAQNGALKGAAFDAISADTSWREETFLLWPQTEALKIYAIRSADPAQFTKAEALATLIFQQYFFGRPAFINQLDVTENVIWPEGLSRMHYHIVLALTEGVRAKIWDIST